MDACCFCCIGIVQYEQEELYSRRQSSMTMNRSATRGFASMQETPTKWKVQVLGEQHIYLHTYADHSSEKQIIMRPWRVFWHDEVPVVPGQAGGGSFKEKKL